MTQSCTICRAQVQYSWTRPRTWKHVLPAQDFDHRATPPDPREPLTDGHDEKWAEDFAQGFDGVYDLEHPIDCYCDACGLDDFYNPMGN